MSTALRLTTAECEAMIDRGAFDSARMQHLELIYGQLREKSPPEPVRLTIEQYESMVDCGAFDVLRDRRIELIRGELRQMSPQRPPHSQAIVYLTYWSTQSTAKGSVKARIQLPLRLPLLQSEPEPDVALVRPAGKRDRHPEPREVVLIIEVADTTLADDLGEKALLYAQAGIADYWVIDLPSSVVHVFREPSDQGYLQHSRHAAGERLTPIALPDTELDIGALFAE